MWLVLLAAGLCEVGFVTFLQKSDGFKNKKYVLLSVLIMGLSIYLLSVATTEIQMGIAYGVWTGIGAVSSVLVGMFFFGESKSLKKIFFVTLIIISVVGLKLTGN